jgi:hypothetical protein
MQLLRRADFQRGRAQSVMMRDGEQRSMLPEHVQENARPLSQPEEMEEKEEANEEEEEGGFGYDEEEEEEGSVGHMVEYEDREDEPAEEEMSSGEDLMEEIREYAKIHPYRGKVRAMYAKTGGTFRTGDSKDQIAGMIKERYGQHWKAHILSYTLQEVEANRHAEEVLE